MPQEAPFGNLRPDGRLRKSRQVREKVFKGGPTEDLNMEALTELLKYVSDNRPKEIVLHWFTKGYKKRLGTVRFKEWPFEESEKEFSEKFDSVFFIEHVNGGNLIGWTSDKGRYENYDESDAKKR